MTSTDFAAAINADPSDMGLLGRYAAVEFPRFV